MSWIYIIPDLLLLIMAFSIFAIDMLGSKEKAEKVVFQLACGGLLLIIATLMVVPTPEPQIFIAGYCIDSFAWVMKQILAISLLFTFLLAKPYFRKKGSLRGTLDYPSEFYLLLLFCTFGMFALVSARDFISSFVAIELATIPLYVLTGFNKRDKKGSEAATKYIIMGGVSTAIMLFGISFVYGGTGSLQFSVINEAIIANGTDAFLNAGIVLVLVSLGFKITMVPFHMWSPDVYEGAPNPVVAFISVSSKAVALAFLIILFYDPFKSLRAQYIPLIMGLACITMLVGNLGALRQSSLRRFMAYSSITQAGYMLVGLVGNGSLSRPSLVYYLFIYTFSNYLAFFLISIVGEKREEKFVSLRGLGKQSPALAAILTLCMFSLAGIPPLAGFTGKFFLFASAAEGQHYFLIVFAALNSTVSLYYYLLWVKEAYIAEPLPEPLLSIEISFIQRWALLVLTGGVLLLGIYSKISTQLMVALG